MMYVKCMQKSCDRLDLDQEGEIFVRNGPIWTLSHGLGRLEVSWGSRGREFESPQPDKFPQVSEGVGGQADGP